MCGIFGFTVELQNDKKREILAKMGRVLVHRGPDAEGFYLGEGVALGHRRLSIIDLSTGDQPMSNEDGSLWIVFNGEIYNFQELREDLLRRGHSFRTASDTEVILHLYEEKGPDCLHDLRGMFAFALWDEREKVLFLARDRVGKKPLFYTFRDGGIIFASEIKAILQWPNLHREMEPEALSYYLTYQYVPPPLTMFKGIYKLPPAHYMVVRGNERQINRYWDLDYLPKQAVTEEEAVEQARSLIEEAVRLRMISDVPLGAFLSGGVDSSIVVAVMSRLSDRPVKTFSIGFEESEYNELPYARRVAQVCATEHHEFIVRAEALKILPELVWYFDEPFADSSAVPTYYVSQMTARYVKVALNGDGGDESFAGYERYLGNSLVKKYQKIPLFLRKHVIAEVLKVGEKIAGQNQFLRRVRWLNQISLDAGNTYALSMTIFPEDLKQELFTPLLQKEAGRVKALEYMLAYYNSSRVEEEIDRMMYSDVMTYLPGDLLVKVDRMSMAHSIEGRSPLLDHRLMEFAARLPGGLKLKGYQLKNILKKVGEQYLPREILYRKKQGFGVPVGLWLRREMKSLLYSLLFNSSLVRDGWLKGEGVRRIVEEHVSDSRDHSHRLWALIMLELWYRYFLEEKISEKPAAGIEQFLEKGMR